MRRPHKSEHCYGNDLNGSLLRFFAISSLDKKEFGIFFNFPRALIVFLDNIISQNFKIRARKAYKSLSVCRNYIIRQTPVQYILVHEVKYELFIPVQRWVPSCSSQTDFTLLLSIFCL